MNLNVTVKTEHTEFVTGITWSTDSQLFSCGDDRIICRWGSDGSVIGKINTISAYLSNLSWFPSVGKQATDMFAASCTDGSIRLISKSGREEKKINAHEGAVICVQWSHDGAALLSAGEDGEVKIWSKNGNLRSTLVSTGQPVYCATWGPDDDQVLIGNDKSLLIKSVQANKKNIQWNAHEGVVSCVDWNVTNQNIVSGGEDCTYKVWDSYGHLLYSSKPMEHVITSIGWNHNGDVFAVGSYNIIKLCDKSGWTHSKERVESGSILSISWTADGTQFAGAGGNGCVVFAQVVGKRLEWKNFEVILTEARKIRVNDISNENSEDLEFPRDRVVELGLGFDTLIVATSSQCYVYSLQSLTTPIIFDVKAPPHFIHMCKKHFLTLDLINGLQVLSYEGKVLSNIRFSGLKPEFTTKDMVALSPDAVAVVDTVDKRLVHVFDPLSGKAIARNQQSTEVSNLSLNQHMFGIQERLLAFSDKNKDLYIASFANVTAASNANSTSLPFSKISNNVESFTFNDETDVLIGLVNGQIHIWYCPLVLFVDKDLLAASMTTEETDYGRNSQIVGFSGSRISVRKMDGSVLFNATASDVELLYELARFNKWDESLRLCRQQKSQPLWATLAALGLWKRNLETVEAALSELHEVVKVEYIQYIQSIPSDEGKQAELFLYRRQPNEAERILLQASPPLVYRAIMLNIQLFRWSRALDIAVKYRSHIDTVLGYRQRYLTQFEREEDDKTFLELSMKVKVDWDAIEAKKQKDLEDEEMRSGKGGRK